MSNRKPCNRQLLDAILGAIEQHRCAVAALRARKLQQGRLAWRLWGIPCVETIPIEAPEEPEWAMMTADIKAAEEVKRELNEHIAALLTHFRRQRHYAGRLSPRSREIAPM